MLVALHEPQPTSAPAGMRDGLINRELLESSGSSNQPANPAARCVRVPECAFPKIQAVNLGIVLAQLDLSQRPPVGGIQLVNGAIDGFGAPQITAVPRQSVRANTGSRNAPDRHARLRLNQIYLLRGRHRHPDLAIYPLQPVGA